MTINNPSTEHGYKIGYGKPPCQGQFKKGQSGNPKGRPKGSKNFATALENELKARVAVIENGKRKNLTKREAIAKQLVNKAISGDPRSMPLILGEIRIREELNRNGDALPKHEIPHNDLIVMDSIINRIREKTVRETSSPDEPKIDENKEEEANVSN